MSTDTAPVPEPVHGHRPMTRYVCIHGHFYQPPRENPWLEVVETQDSAHPYHDWNERITAECYGPNTAAQVLDQQGRIARLVNTYSHISFNVGPTLLSWLQTQAPEAYQGILDADRVSRERFGGHGSAMAQAYNHLIMPLANRRDRQTQVIWGLRDFQHRFGRPAEGMWLPETAVDNETLEVLAEQGVAFTVLAPHQAGRIRPLDGGDWTDVTGAAIDPKRAYLQRLPSGRTITLFFYDGPISKAIAFDQLLSSGQRLAHRLTTAFDPAQPSPQLVQVATDGETYGHHHRFGDMALAHAIELLHHDPDVELTNYSAFLAQHPPAYEVEIIEATAWSCAHGVERWRSDCGCSTGGNPGWSQAWRAPLRAALDDLRDDLAALFEQAAVGLLPDPWRARDAAIDLVLDRSPEQRSRFLARHGDPGLDQAGRVHALTLLEMQRQAMLMYTSCGWFFDDIGGIEATQVLLYAARAAELAQAFDGVDRTAIFKRRLEEATGNTTDAPNGRVVFERSVAAASVDIERAAAHAALAELTGLAPRPTPRWSFAMSAQPQRARHRGDTMASGALQVTDALTGHTAVRSYLAVRANGQAPQSWTAPDGAPLLEASQQFRSAGAAGVGGALTSHQGVRSWGVPALFGDDRRRLLQIELGAHLRRVAQTVRQHYPDLLPPSSRAAAMADDLQPLMRAVLMHELVIVLGERPTSAAAPALFAAAQAWGVALDDETLGYALTGAINRLVQQLAVEPGNAALWQSLRAALATARGHRTLPVNTWLPLSLVGRWRMHQGMPTLRANSAAVGRDEAATHDGATLLNLIQEAS